MKVWLAVILLISPAISNAASRISAPAILKDLAEEQGGSPLPRVSIEGVPVLQIQVAPKPINAQNLLSGRVVEQDAWDRLILRIKQDPMDERVNGAEYRVLARFQGYHGQAAPQVQGLNCPPDTDTQIAAFIILETQSLDSPKAPGVVPVRITAQCMGKRAIQDVLNIVADPQGNVIRSSLYSTSQPQPMPTEPEKLKELVSRIIDALTQLEAK